MLTETRPPTPKMLTLEDVLELTGVSRSTIYALMRRRVFPLPRKLTNNLNGWLESEVREWLASRPVAEIAELED